MGKTVGIIVGIVAIAAVIYFAPFLAPALMSLGIPSAVATALATAAVTTVISIGASMIFRGLSIGVPTAKGAAGPPTVFRQSISDSFIVYGQRRVGGLMVFFHSIQGSTGAHWRYFVIACAGHRCQGVVTWHLNDETVSVNGAGMVTSGKYANYAWLWFQRGLASETANATFVAECGGKWTAAHKGNGIAAIYAKFKLNDDIVAAGMPNITAEIEGRDEILDTRTSTTGYSNNAALVFYDWMSIPREEGGFGSYADEVPDTSWINAQANVCDEVIDGEARYTLNAVLTTGSAPAEVRDTMIVNMAGSYTFSGGKHLMRPGYWVPVSATLKEDDFAAPIQISPFFASDVTANEVQGTFIDPTKGYQGAPFTTQTISSVDIRQLDLDLAFTTSLGQADRVARIMLNRAQCEKTVVVTMNIAGLNAKTLDMVQLDSARYSLSNYAFVVSNWSLSADFGAVLSLREENEDIYGDLSPVTPPTPPVIVQPPGPIQTLLDVQNILRNTYPKGMAVAAIDAGTTATVTLSIRGGFSDVVFDYPGTLADVVVTGFPATFTGKAFSTIYYPYADLADIGDTAPVYGLATVYADAINSSTNPLRVYLNQQVTTPADGGAGTGGTGGGGGYGGGTSGGTDIP